jgi:hypothetical protein
VVKGAGGIIEYANLQAKQISRLMNNRILDEVGGLKTNGGWPGDETPIPQPSIHHSPG